ncbi:MAG: LamG domain-containing protein, partial [Candidatus Riflebacteria bacterium]|nr:LamG domain-containing protein [Candidatus Riflebacteria bacterium]
DNPGELGSDSDDDEAEPDRGAGRSGGGLIFDGKDDLVRVKESSSLRLRQAVTLEAWIWWEPTSQWQPIIARSDWPRRAFGLYLHESRLINLSYVSAAGNVAAIQSAAGVVPARQWVHVAGTIDTVAGAMRLYVNGIEVARGSSADSLAEAPGLPVQLGAADAGYPASCRPFKGALDEVVIYNRALSASEVAGRWAGR